MNTKDDESKGLTKGFLRIIITLGIIGLLWIGLGVKKVEPIEKLEDNILTAVNSSIIVREQSYGTIFYNLEEVQPVVTWEMQKVITCESGGDHSKIGDTNFYVNGKQSPSYGIAQFQKATWYHMSQLSGIYGDINNENDQLILMKWMFDHGYAYQWSCWRKLFGSAI